MLIRRLPSLPSWGSAFGELDEMRREMDRLLHAFTGEGQGRTAGVYPAINVSESDAAVVVQAELPGVDPGKPAPPGLSPARARCNPACPGHGVRDISTCGPESRDVWP